MGKKDSIEYLFSAVRAQNKAALAKDPADKVAVLRATLQPHQRLLEKNRARHVAVISPRQTGKSTGIMLIVAIRCFEKAASEWVVVGLTRPSVKRIYWSPLKKLNEVLELGLKFHDQDLVATFPNGSRVFFVGGETSSEIEKLRGGRYDGAVVDECKSYSASVFEALIDEILQPALNTKRGPLLIIGTPGEVLEGEFFMATVQPAIVFDTPLGKRTSNALYPNDGVAKWSLHVWTLKDNTAVPHLWTDALLMKDRNGWGDDHPVWMREYLGRWVAGDHLAVYRYASYRHNYVPSGAGRFGLAEDHTWLTVCGVDFGTRDGCAIVVWAYSATSPGLWEVYSEVKRTEKGDRYPLGAFAAWYRKIESEFGPFQMAVADSSMPLVLDTLADEWSIYLESAEKREKPDHIELMNFDLDRNLIRTLTGSPLSKELAGNRWDEKQLAKGKREEDRKTPNDTCDAALYSFRWAHHRRAKDRALAVPPGSTEWWAAVKNQELEQLRSDARRRASADEYARLDTWEN